MPFTPVGVSAMAVADPSSSTRLTLLAHSCEKCVCVIVRSKLLPWVTYNLSDKIEPLRFGESFTANKQNRNRKRSGLDPWKFCVGVG